MPIKKDDMTYDKKKKALKYPIFLKENRDGTIKAHGCTDEQPQRLYTTQEEASSPMVSLEALILSCAIDAKENRHMAVTDIPGAFLHADMERIIHIILEGEIAKLSSSLILKHIWTTYGLIQKGRRCCCAIKRALYWTLQAELLF